ncbi:deoxyribodipyrimidine photo-lyase [Paenibacillus sp. FSL H8-0048]|uniref:cryptochrome/photolyase family protein n=1 Tax=Paenibacillus sp. FSL H8-0048 TaxID=2954508 RepID=UPI0030F80620
MILFIHRKDLRTADLPAFDAIAAAGVCSLHVLILEPFLLRNKRYLEHSGRNFLQHVARLRQEYAEQGKQLHLLYGEPEEILRRLAQLHPIQEVSIHADYTPYALKRDQLLRETAHALGLRFQAPHDRMLCDDLEDFMDWCGRSEPFKVFTPFYRRWRTYLAQRFRPPYTEGVESLQTADLHPEVRDAFRIPEEITQQLTPMDLDAKVMNPGLTLEDFIMKELRHYPDTRDQYAEDRTSRMSSHLNVGAISARAVYSRLIEENGLGEEWLRQLAWRDFYLYQARLDGDFFNYEKVYDLSALGTQHFEAWSQGRTGVPVIDAAMRQLNATGWMPNRLRMITAMFLTKNLGCPFIYGERYFRLKLSDYDNAQNRGGWLWSSSLGFDASPYFRVMNPVTQSQTHDPGGSYIRTWLPERADWSDKDIHLPADDAIVDLKRSRALAIEVYKEIMRSRKK